MTVRQPDAHAWAEVWLPQRGWVRIDPTAAVSPNRIERSIAVAPTTEPMLGGLINLHTGRGSWIAALRFRWDALDNSWNQWVLNYTPERQKNLLRSLGFGNIGWQTMALLMCLVGAIVMLIIAVPLLAGRRGSDPIEALYASLCRRMGRRGFPRHPHEGPRTYANRLLEQSALTPAMHETLRRFLSLYEQTRYGHPASLADALSQLKTLLNRIR